MGDTVAEIIIDALIKFKNGLDGLYAKVQHGNHIPTSQTADNATFLRNDNTWQKVTPANIGAATSENVETLFKYLDMCTNMLSGYQSKTNLLQVSLSDPLNAVNKVHKISTSDASTLTGSPVTTGTFIAKWECVFYTTNRILVVVTEFYPSQGRVWTNHYNSTAWSGWIANGLQGAASTIGSNNLTASRALVSDNSGKVGVSAVTSTELGYLDGVTSAIQTQLNGKAPSSHTHSYLPLSGGTITGTTVPLLVLNNSNNGNQTLQFKANGAIRGYIQNAGDKSGFMSIGGGNFGPLVIDTNTGHLRCDGNGKMALGDVDNRFATIYTTNTVNVSSLEKLKTEIKPFESALEEIDKTDVYNYKLKRMIEKNGDDIVNTGFVIGENYKLSDYLLADTKDGIDLYNAVGVVFGGVKELYELVKQQQKEIESLRAETETIKATL